MTKLLFVIFVKNSYQLLVFLLKEILILHEKPMTFNPIRRNLMISLEFQIPDEDDELDGNDGIGDCCCLNSVPNMFEYDHTLIPEEPNFFTAGYISSKEDK